MRRYRRRVLTEATDKGRVPVQGNQAAGAFCYIGFSRRVGEIVWGDNFKIQDLTPKGFKTCPGIFASN